MVNLALRIFLCVGAFNPVSIAVFESNLVWLSQSAGKVLSGNKFGQGDITTIQTGLHMPRSIQVFHINTYDISSEF